MARDMSKPTTQETAEMAEMEELIRAEDKERARKKQVASPPKDKGQG